VHSLGHKLLWFLYIPRSEFVDCAAFSEAGVALFVGWTSCRQGIGYILLGGLVGPAGLFDARAAHKHALTLLNVPATHANVERVLPLCSFQIAGHTPVLKVFALLHR